jgi:DNA-binding CsgD family transcriptional regulator
MEGSVAQRKAETRTRGSNTPDLNFGPPEWLHAITEVAQAVGRPVFDQKLFELLNRILHIDHCVVFTYSEREGPGHLFTRSRMPPEEAEELARDYVTKYYERDPHFAQACGPRSTSEAEPIRPSFSDEYDSEYRDHFFTRHGLIDKISTVGHVDEGNVYCNFYRMGDSGRYSRRDEKLLRSVLPLITSLISSHFTIASVTGTGAAQRDGNVARSLVHSVISRGVEPFDRLTPREAEICERILVGYTSNGISLDLGIAISSVNTYRRRAYERLGIATQNELFSMCLEALNRVRMPQ